MRPSPAQCAVCPETEGLRDVAAGKRTFLLCAKHHDRASEPPPSSFDDLGSAPWHAERSAPGELRAQTTVSGVSLSLGISLRGRPPRHELRITGSRGTLYADLYHGYGWCEGSTTSRGYKIARPFWLAVLGEKGEGEG